MARVWPQRHKGGTTKHNGTTTFKINADRFGKALLFLNVLLDVQYHTRCILPFEADDLQCRHILFIWLTFVHLYIRGLSKILGRNCRSEFPTPKQEQNFISIYGRKHVGSKVQPNNALTHVRRTSVL